MPAMPEMDIKLILFLVGVGLFTLVAAVSDLRTRRIPNTLTVPMFLLGLVYQGVFNGTPGLIEAGKAFGFGFGVLFILWLVGGGGGGDVKLMGALAVWLGFRMTLLVVVVSTLFVIVGTMGVMAWSVLTRGARKTKRKYLATGRSEKRRSPQTETIEQRQQRRLMAYALPVALATWFVVMFKLPTL